MDNRNMKILIVDDEENIRRLLKIFLEREKYIIEEANDGNIALNKAMENEYDLILLDLMMPKKNGIEVCKEIRKQKATPIIMLTAKGEEENRVQGFLAGTDDYIVKPFSPREVVFRVKSLLRRVSLVQNIIFPQLTIDPNTHRVLADDNNEAYLTQKEFELLYFLAKAPDKVFDREQLLKEVWQYEILFGDLRTVDTHIKRIRQKLFILSDEAAKMIVTVRGVGYKFKAPT